MKCFSALLHKSCNKKQEIEEGRLKFRFILVSCYFFLIAGLFFFPLSANCAELPAVVDIESILYNSETDKGESVAIKLSGHRTPKIFRIKGDNPRLVIDFPQALYKGKSVIPLPESTLANGIRIGVHKTPALKTRVVIDLSSGHKSTYEKSFSDQSNTLTLTLSSPEVKKVEQEEVKVQAVTEKKVVDVEPKVVDVEPEAERVVPPAAVLKKPVPPEETGATGHEGDPQLLEITFDDSSNKGEMVIFRLNDFFPPTVSAIEKETPRVLCDFMDMQLGSDVNKEIFANGKFVERIRTTQHKGPDKVRVSLDLSADRDYDLQQVFFKNDNLFVIIVNELQPEVVENSDLATE